MWEIAWEMSLNYIIAKIEKRTIMQQQFKKKQNTYKETDYCLFMNIASSTLHSFNTSEET